MSTRETKNVAASIRARLLEVAHNRREEFELTLTRYALERLFYRIGKSAHRESFVLKGAMLFTLWGVEDYRATRDGDFLVHGDPDLAQLERIFRDLCAAEVEPDGLVFRADTVRAEAIREEDDYGGVRVAVRANLDSADIAVRVDIGFGDAVTPDAKWEEFPTLLALPAPKLRTYPRETVIAEKYEAMVRFGIANSRMKDFYDVFMLAREFDFDGVIFSEAIRNTFARRGTALPENVPTALTSEFYNDRQKVVQWKAFCARGRLRESRRSLKEVCEALDVFLMLPTQAALQKARFTQRWRAGGPWKKVG